jgi:hypothetical protein
LVACAGACGPDKPEPTVDALRQPTGLRLSDDGRWAFVSNGNWDRSELGGAVLALDLGDLHRALDGGGGGACRGDATPIRCRAAEMIVAGTALGRGSAVGNLALDKPSGDLGTLRLFTVQRDPAAVLWFDVDPTREPPTLDCGLGIDGGCDAAHTVVASPERPDLELPGDPSRIVLDDQGYRFGYVPQLIGPSFSLLALDGEVGPELVDVVSEFFRSDPFEDTDYAGGFGVASRPCDPDDPPGSTRDCTRPFAYATQRYFPGVRRFTVATGLDVVSGAGESSVLGANPESVVSVPFMGDLAFEDPEAGTSLLVVQTSPSALLRVDTSLGDDGEPGDAVRATLSLCEQPNLLAVHRPLAGEPLALVTCYGEGALAIVGLSSFRLVATIAVGDGANEIAIDPARDLALVANTREDSIAVVSLDRTDAAFATVVARID